MRNRFVGVVFVAMLCAMFLRVSIVYAGLGAKYLEAGGSGPAFDAAAAYPFRDGADGIPESPEGSVLWRVYAAFGELKDLISEYMGSNASHFPDLVTGKRLLDRAMGLDMTASLTAGEADGGYDDVVAVWEDGYLGFVAGDPDNSDFAAEAAAFGKRMLGEGRNFLYLVTSSKPGHNVAYPDHSRELRENLLRVLEENGIDAIDIVDAAISAGMDMADMFFRTDHHWLPSVGIRADGLLCAYLDERCGYDIDVSVFDMENYDTVVYEDCFLGSQGRKVTTAYCDKEDFPVVVPKYDTDLDVFISKTGSVSSGRIQDTLLDYESLEMAIADPYVWDAYNFYGYGNQALVAVHNNRVHDASRVLIIKTSDANVMIPYLSAVVEDLYVIDPRRFDGSLRMFIDETDPDTVVVVAGALRLEDFGFSDAIGD